MIKRIFLILASASFTALYFAWPHLMESPQFTTYIEMARIPKLVSLFNDFKVEVVRTNKYEGLSFRLLQRNRDLEAKVSQLRSRVSDLEAQSRFFASRYQQPVAFRSPASLKKERPVDEKNDLVQFATYKWKDKKLLSIARKEWQRENYDKAAQFFYTLLQTYPRSRLIDDEVLFQTAIASLQAKIYGPWAEQALNRLIEEYPRSRYYRGAKLWRALAYFEQGDRERFYQTLEEFRLKYRNTPEWRILSKYYGKTISDHI